MKQVSQSQIYMLFSHFLFATTLIFVMSQTIETAQYMAWLALLLGGIGGLLLTYLSFRLARKRPTQFFVHYGKKIVGRWLHYPLIVFMIFNFLFTGAYIIRDLQDFIIQVYLPGTPAWAVAALLGVCLVYAVRSGIVTIFRSGQGIFYASILVFFLVPFFLRKEINFDMAIALVNHFELKGVWNGTYAVTSLFGEMMMILFLFPYFISPEKTMRSLIGATATSLFIILTSLIPIILIFGPKLAANLPYVDFELIRYIPTGSFYENVDPILIAIWLSSVFIKICLFLFVAVIMLTHTFSLTDHKPFALSMAAAMVILSLLMVNSTSELGHLMKHGLCTFLLLSESIPILYLVVDWVRSYRVKA